LKPSTIGIPLLFIVAFIFYIADGGEIPFIQQNDPAKPATPSPERINNNSSSTTKNALFSTRSLLSYESCMKESRRIYNSEISNHRKISAMPEVDYGRLRDDRYGKGLNTIWKERLLREEDCKTL
tara:strand:+ start:70 stop:444 length:375 start_codon:yes stop_codon:yes gene_type:complete